MPHYVRGGFEKHLHERSALPSDSPSSLSLPNHTILQSSLERECQNVTCSTQLLILNLSRRPLQVMPHPCAFPSSSKAQAITISSKVTAAFTSSAHLAHRCTTRPNTSGLHHLLTASLGCAHLQRDVLESCRLSHQSLPL